MKKFMTCKLVEVEEMSRYEYVASRNWPWVDNEDHLKDERVFKVVYPDGYTSMCPRDKFLENALEVTEDDKIPNFLVESFVNHWEVLTVHPNGKPCTQVYATLRNGAVLGEFTTCVDPKNYSEEIGFQICKKKIEDKIWFMLGMQLQSAKYGV